MDESKKKLECKYYKKMGGDELMKLRSKCKKGKKMIWMGERCMYERIELMCFMQKQGNNEFCVQLFDGAKIVKTRNSKKICSA